MKKWGKRIVSGVIAASILTGAAISKSEPAKSMIASVVQAGTETSFMGELLRGEYIEVFTSWTEEEQKEFYEALSPEKQAVFLEVTNCQIIKQFVKTGKTRKDLDQTVHKLQPYFLLLKKGNKEKPEETVVMECINEIEMSEYESTDQYLRQIIPEKQLFYMDFYRSLEAVKNGKGDIQESVDYLYKKLGFKEEEEKQIQNTSASRPPAMIQKKAAAKAASDGFSNFKAVSSLKGLKDAIAGAAKGAKIAVRIDKGFSVTSVIKTNGRHVKIYADSVSGHNLSRTSGYKSTMIEVNGGSLTLGAYDGDGRAKNNIYINGKGIAATAPMIKVTSGQLYLNKYSRITDGYFLGDFAGGSGIELNSGTSCYLFGGKIDKCSSASSKDVSSSSQKSSHGGGVLVNNGASFYMFSGSIENCKAIHGGGIMGYGTVRLYGGTVSGCAASNKKKDALGGAVKIQGAINEDGKISATKGDLGIWKYTRSSTWAVNGKDGYQQGSTSGITLKNNNANAGGAICLNNSSKGVVQDCSIYGNSSTGNGAGICLSNGSYKKGASLEIKGSAGIRDNTSKGYGGGLYCADSVKGSISGGSVYNNTASYGAGIYHEAEFLISGGAIKTNHSDNSGGGIYAKGKLVMNGGEISSNAAKTYGGGAIIKNAGGSFSGGKIKNNSAVINGGGLQLDGTVSFSNASVSENTASEKGGGIAVSSGGGIQMNKSSVSGNTAKVSGGGIYIDGTCKANGSSFTGNQSSGDGGAVYVGGGTFTTFQANQAVTIQGNSASGNGSGIYNNHEVILNNNAHVLNNQCKNGTQRNIFHGGSLFSVEGNSEVDQEIYLARDRFITASSPYFANGNSLTARVSMDSSNVRNGYAVVKGNVTNTGDGNYKSGDALLHNQSVNGRFSFTGAGYVLRPGNYKKASSGCAPYSIVLSQAYKIRYDKNSKEEIRNMPTEAVKYWEEDLRLSELRPAGEAGAFVAWNTKSDGTGDGYQPGNIYTANIDATLYALWPRYKVEYLPGIQGTSGKTDSQEQNKSEDILLRKNGFQSSEGKFMCWKQDTYNAKKRNEMEPTGYTELKEEKQGRNQDYLLGFSKKMKRLSADYKDGKNYSLLDMDDIFKMKGQWDFKPNIFLKDKKVFIENEKVDRDKLLELVESCNDLEDGDLTSNVRIIKIKYDKTKGGWNPKEQDFPVGMNKTQLMDTYFMMLEKDETVNVKVTYQVEDGAGNITEKVGNVYVIYNNPPKLHSFNLAFYQEDVKIKPQTIQKEILENCKVEDLEDDKQGLKVPVSVVDPSPFLVEKLESIGEYKIVYQAIDSLGKKTKLESEIYIAENSPYKNSYIYHVRFINKEYFYTLKETSKWKKDEELSADLRKQLDKAKDDVVLKYHFKSEK